MSGGIHSLHGQAWPTGSSRLGLGRVLPRLGATGGVALIENHKNFEVLQMALGIGIPFEVCKRRS
ncbi:unnamed protein product [Prunus armeniaca]